MNIKSLIVLLPAILLINGCSDKSIVYHNYTYVGENKNWSAKYVVTGKGEFIKNSNQVTHYNSQSKSVFTLTYKGSLADLESIKHFEYGYESSVGSQKLTEDTPPKEKVITLKSSSKGGAFENKDEVIRAKIIMDGITESIELKSK